MELPLHLLGRWAEGLRRATATAGAVRRRSCTNVVQLWRWVRARRFVCAHVVQLLDLDQETDFIGKEALKKIKEDGIKEKLVGLELDGDPLLKAPENFWPVNNSEKKVGRVSRAFFSPRLKKNIALAIVDIEFADEGSKLVVESPYGDLNSVVVKMPWFQAEKDTNLD